jgi:hypothetical protein
MVRFAVLKKGLYLHSCNCMGVTTIEASDQSDIINKKQAYRAWSHPPIKMRRRREWTAQPAW